MEKVHCSTCGEAHDLSEMEPAFDRPDAYFAVHPDDRDRRCTMTDDLADIDRTHFFVRGVLPLPVRGEGNDFGWGVWACVGATDFHRYVDLFRDDRQRGEPPFPGTLANQLPGYPQTLGLPLAVQLSSAVTRPIFTVTQGDHLLAVEQQHGVYPERVLELLSPLLHAGRPDPAREPRFAELERDRWTLLDAVERFHARDRVLWVPNEEDRRAVSPGELVKLLFCIVASDEAGAPASHVERMWVEVDHRREDAGVVGYSGLLANDPYNPGWMTEGMRVWFRPEHVIDIEHADRRRASKEADVLRCADHGPSQKTFVCRHLVRGSDLGFHQATDPGNPRPDAWCDACNALLEEEGEWNDRTAEAADITLLCAACYDEAEARNRRA